jgi:hypothetical protein
MILVLYRLAAALTKIILKTQAISSIFPNSAKKKIWPKFIRTHKATA